MPSLDWLTIAGRRPFTWDDIITVKPCQNFTKLILESPRWLYAYYDNFYKSYYLALY